MYLWWVGSMLVGLVVGLPSDHGSRFDTRLNSQHFMNGTTAVERTHHDSVITMHFNEARYPSTPLLNFTNFFNRLDRSVYEDKLVDFVLPTTSPSPENSLNDNNKSVPQWECRDDKVELDYMHFRAISLENNLTRLAIDCNYTLVKYSECKLERASLEKKLNYTTESWTACKRFCG